MLRRAFRHDPFLASIALVSLTSGLIILAIPPSVLPGSAVLESWAPWVIAWIWPLTYASSGGFILYGLGRRRIQPVVAGLTLYTFLLGLYIWSIIDYTGGVETVAFVISLILGPFLGGVVYVCQNLRRR